LKIGLVFVIECPYVVSAGVRASDTGCVLSKVGFKNHLKFHLLDSCSIIRYTQCRSIPNSGHFKMITGILTRL